MTSTSSKASNKTAAKAEPEAEPDAAEPTTPAHDWEYPVEDRINPDQRGLEDPVRESEVGDIGE